MQVKAMKYLVKVSPAGEIQDCLEHLIVLAGGEDKIKTSSGVLNALKKWYETHHYHIKCGDKVGMISPQGYVGEGDAIDQFIYYDSTQNFTFKFDPITQKGEIVDAEAPAIASSKFREDLVKQLQEYQEGSFRKGKMLFAVHQQANEGH